MYRRIGDLRLLVVGRGLDLEKKTIELKSVTAHRPRAKPGIRGRAPSVSEIRFTPDELFGAMARCSHLHPVDAGAVTFESEGCRHLLSQHVDDQADHFAILPTARRLKDFSRTHMVGVVGAGTPGRTARGRSSAEWLSERSRGTHLERPAPELACRRT